MVHHRCATSTFATDEVSTKFVAEDVRAEELLWAERDSICSENQMAFKYFLVSNLNFVPQNKKGILSMFP